MTTQQKLSENIWKENGASKSYYSNNAFLEIDVKPHGVFVSGRTFDEKALVGSVYVGKTFTTIDEAEEYVASLI